MLSQHLDHEYGPIGGLGDFCKLAIDLALGENNQYSAGGLVSIYLLLYFIYWF